MAWHDGLDVSSTAYDIATCSDRFIRVTGGPGSGKSFAMTRRVARLLDEKVAPERILAITFTSAEAQELRHAVTALGTPGADNLHVTTFAECALDRLAMEDREWRGNGPRLCSDFLLTPLVFDLAKSHGGEAAVRVKIASYLAAVARQERPVLDTQVPEPCAFLTDLASLLKLHHAVLPGELGPRLVERKDVQSEGPFNFIDFTRSYEHVLVDEFQELTRAEQAAIDVIAGAGSICIFGDHDQVVAQARHANPEGLLGWNKTHADIGDYHLAESWRCPRRVSAAADALIAHAGGSNRKSLAGRSRQGEGKFEIKECRSTADEINMITQRIALMIEGGVNHQDILVLPPNPSLGLLIENRLRARGIPVCSHYLEEELRRPIAQEKLAYLFSLGAREPLVWRVLLGRREPGWGVKPYGRVIEYCLGNELGTTEVVESLATNQRFLRDTQRLAKRFRTVREEEKRLLRLVSPNKHFEGPKNAHMLLLDEEWADFTFDVFIDSLSAGGDSELLNDPQEDFFDNETLKREKLVVALIDDLFPANDPDLCQLRRQSLMAAQSDKFYELAEALRERMRDAGAPPAGEEVQIMDLARSKGRQAPVVFVPGCIEGFLPKLPPDTFSDSERGHAIDADRRLLYVAMTRVVADLNDGKPGTLVLSHSSQIPAALARRAGLDANGQDDGLVPARQSRFLEELTGSKPPARIACSGTW